MITIRRFAGCRLLTATVAEHPVLWTSTVFRRTIVHATMYTLYVAGAVGRSLGELALEIVDGIEPFDCCKIIRC